MKKNRADKDVFVLQCVECESDENIMVRLNLFKDFTLSLNDNTTCIARRGREVNRAAISCIRFCSTFVINRLSPSPELNGMVEMLSSARCMAWEQPYPQSLPTHWTEGSSCFSP
ncbi:hypothetical protein V6N12_043228 [Hibiscus sabdariffa]|uniref:Uncharacterized protein n=1 Tax=Hibiscus sabdariffa TaxID=183260 RepID=A0ABR2DDP8_9ROSI